MAPFLRNAWYAVAWTEEIDPGRLLSRKIAEVALVVARGRDGSTVVFRDMCPHRFAPLSRGCMEADEIVCGYHGLRFDLSGACVGSPFSEKLPAGARLVTYPCVCRDDIVWTWTGDPELADPDLIPDFSFLTNSDRRIVRGSTKVEADYRLSIDNLMDLSHLEFVHTGTFGGHRIIDQSACSVEDRENIIEVEWSMPGIPAPRPGLMAERVDHWLRMRWHAPSALDLEIGFKAAGAEMDSAIIDPQAHIVTPIDASSSWYFWAAPERIARKEGDPHDPERKDLRAAFEREDKPMLEAVQTNMRPDGDLFAMQPTYLRFDEAGLRVRRRLAKMIADEGGGGAGGDES